MRHKLIPFAVVILVLADGGIHFRFAPPAALAQSQNKGNQDKQKRKEFGSSLKRLKWNKATQTVVEEKGRPDRREGETADDVIRIKTELVVCDVMVLDPQGHVVNGLTRDDFVVAEDDQPQQVTHLSLGNDVNRERSIVLIIDYSGSLLSYIDRTIDAAEILVDKLGPKDHMAIVTDDVALLVNFTTDKVQLKKALESLRKKALKENHVGHSEQFSALLATARELFHEEDVRPIIIFQTDGDQIIYLQPPDPEDVVAVPVRRSRIKQFSINEVKTAVEKSRAIVYTVTPGFRLIGIGESEQLRRVKVQLERGIAALPMPEGLRRTWHPSPKVIADSLRVMLLGQRAAAEVATLTGGWSTYLEQPEQAGEIYANILADVNDRYVVGYYPTNKVHDGKRRQVALTVRNHPEYTLWGRKSYFAPEPEQ
jgi:VWFA-related protein